MIGALRVVGVTRREIFSLIVAEAVLLGLLGTAAGLLLGIVLAQGLVRLVTQTITDLYFVVSVRELTISGLGLPQGLGGWDSGPAWWPPWLRRWRPRPPSRGRR